MLDVDVQLVLANRTFAAGCFRLEAQARAARFEGENFSHPTYLLSRSTFAKARSRIPDNRMKPVASAC